MIIKFRNKIFAVVLLLSLLTASCGARNDPDSVSGVGEGETGQSQGASGGAQVSSDNGSGMTAVADFHYLEMDSMISEWSNSSYAINGEWLYITDKIEDEEADKEYFGITRKRISDGYQEKNYAVSSVEYRSDWNRPLLLADNEGNCYIFWKLSEWEEEEEAIIYAYSLEKYGPDGSLLWSNGLETDELADMGEMLDQGMVTADGRVILYSYGAGGCAFCFGAEGSLEEVYTPELDSLEGVVAGKDNRIYGYCVTGKEPVFMELGGEGERCVCPMVPLAVYSGYGEGICLRTGEGMFAYEPETGETERLWGWNDEYVQLSADSIDSVFQDSGTFVLLCFEMPNSGINTRQVLTVAAVTLEDSSAYPGRQKIILATDFLNSNTETIVQMYNRQSRDYRVEVTVTGNGETLQKKVLRGEDMDVMEVSRIYRNDLARLGAFEELDSYYENSVSLEQEDILESVREACAIGGKNVTVIPGFWIQTMRARGDFLAGTDWTVWKFLELGEENRMFSSQNPSYALNWCMGMQYGEHFIDYENRTCSFDGEEFRQILEACSRWGEYTEYSEYGYRQDGSTKRGNWLFDLWTITSVRDIVQRETTGIGEYYEYEGDNYSATLVGYPGWEGGVYSLETSLVYAINSASKNKDGAWDFLEYLLSEELQARMNQMGNLPVRKESFEACLRDDYADPIVSKPILQTEKDIQQMEKMVDSAVLKNFGTAFNPVWSIVSDEAAMYFAGDATLDATVEKIQTRVQLYLGEM